MKLILPMPPSVNSLYRNVPGRGRVPSGLYQRWRKAADDAMWGQKKQRIEGPVIIVITLQPKGRYDVDNKIKAVLDLLVRYGIIEDDDHHIVKQVTSRIGDVVGCEVEIGCL